MALQGGSKLAVTSIPDSYIAISICLLSKIRVMNATPDVKDMPVRLDQEIATKSRYNRGPLIEYYGTLKMKIGDNFTFYPGRGGKTGETLANFFALRLLEEMHNLGYDLIVSSDVAISSDNATLFFAKSEVPDEKRGNAKVCCIAPGGAGSISAVINKLVLLHHDDEVKAAVMLALEDAWPKGVSGTQDIDCLGEVLHEITLNGRWGWTKEDGISTRNAICNLMGRMGVHNWRLLTSTNLKGTADSFFFIYDPTLSTEPNDFCMLTLAQKDRFRLINCGHLLEPMESAIVSAGFSILEKEDYYGSHEIKVNGTPWYSSDHEAIAARRSISRIMEVFGQNGYTPLYAIDVRDTDTEKASILFQKNPNPVNCRYACLSLSDRNRMRLLDFPSDVAVQMKDSLYQFYPFGIRNETNLPDSNVEINANGFPWDAGNFTKGADQYHMRAVLGKMMAIAAKHSWYVSISADVSSKITGGQNARHPMDAHSIYFVKMQ